MVAIQNTVIIIYHICLHILYKENIIHFYTNFYILVSQSFCKGEGILFVYVNIYHNGYYHANFSLF